MQSWMIGAAVTVLVACGAATPAMAEETLTIATVNNGDMIRMEKFSKEFTEKNPDVKLAWVTLEENVLRQRVTNDIATHGGQFDVLTIGTYEVPIWAKQGWLLPLESLGRDYDYDDLLPKIRASMSYDGKLYASPFTGESSFTFYRKDLFQKAGLTMPDRPTWDFVFDAARKIDDRASGIYGICLRGKAGWGENMGLLAAMANSYGARWFDEQWKPQFDQPEWRKMLTDYVGIMRQVGPPGAAANGANENLALFESGKCGLWVDDTVFASFAVNPQESRVSDKVGFAFAPTTGVGKSANWLWTWGLAIPAGTRKREAAERFIGWATDRAYTEFVASKLGWANVAAGTRKSLYANKDYVAAATFAPLVLSSIDEADPDHPTVKPVPYVGVTYPSIPQYPTIGTQVGQIFAAAVTGNLSVGDALDQAQKVTLRVMEQAGYYK